jgi:tRNA-binding protein
VSTIPTIDTFATLDIRVGRVLNAAPLAKARTPAYAMTIDLGPEIGRKQSSAQITAGYPEPDALIGRLVLCVVNLPVRRVAGYESQVLTLGVYASSDGRPGAVSLVGPDAAVPCVPGDRLG